MAPQPMSLSAPPASSRARPQVRKKRDDDAAYIGQLGAGAKRQALERADGEPRTKRKRVDPIVAVHHRKGLAREADVDERDGVVNFADLPPDAIHRYLLEFNLTPRVWPSPMSADDPPPPGLLFHPEVMRRGHSPSPPVTAANRPRRDPKEQKRRSSRMLEEEMLHREPVLADKDDVHAVLAAIAQEHFRAAAVRELDTLSAFMVKARSGSPRV